MGGAYLRGGSVMILIITQVPTVSSVVYHIKPASVMPQVYHYHGARPSVINASGPGVWPSKKMSVTARKSFLLMPVQYVAGRTGAVIYFASAFSYAALRCTAARCIHKIIVV